MSAGTILLVEDAEALRLLVREMLEGAGYTVLEADGPDKALSLAQSTPDPIHLVLTDMVMPQMNGQELARRIATFKPEAAVILMSVRQALDAGPRPARSPADG